MNRFWKNMDKISFGMLAQGGYFQADALAAIHKKMSAQQAIDAASERTVSYRSTPSVHQQPFRVCA